jgi:glyceraldehyde 3-phosphate dehydrogenase
MVYFKLNLGKFKGTIEINQEKNQLIINGNIVQFIYSDDPSDIDYEKYEITNAILIDNVSKFIYYLLDRSLER